MRDESRRVIAALQARYADETGIRALKIRHNNVLGYFVDVTAQHGDRLMAAPLNATLHPPPDARRAGALHDDRTRRIGIQDRQRRRPRARARTGHLRAALRRRRRGQRPRSKPAREALAELDVASALAQLAVERDYARPDVDDSSRLRRSKAAGIPSSNRRCRRTARRLSPTTAISPRRRETGAGRIWLITGPNMAGKSTFLRQNALIAILAQMGSFVPAKRAHIGVVDRLFSRVGAADDLARGRSTFMVEMVETAAILNQARRARAGHPRRDRPRHRDFRRPLDRLGDGRASARRQRCRALFATHFHELTALAARLDRLHNATVRVKEWQGDVVFLHEVVAGAADRSYGIQVAKLAGLPASVIERAKVVLAKLEAGRPRRAEGLRGPAAVCRAATSRRRQSRHDATTCSRPPSPRSIPTTCRRARRWKRSTRLKATAVAKGAQSADDMMNVAERKQANCTRASAALAGALRRRRCRRDDAAAAAELFLPDGLWRDVLAFTWNIETQSGRARDRAHSRRDARAHAAVEFLQSRPSARRRAGSRARAPMHRSHLRIRYRVRPCATACCGSCPIRTAPRACAHGRWSPTCTNCGARGSLQAPRGQPKTTRDFGAPELARPPREARAPMPIAIRRSSSSAAARPASRSPRGCSQLGIDTLIVDRHARVGDNWRKRYHSLTLHNEVHVNHLPYMPFPPTWPVLHPEGHAGELVRVLCRRAWS